MSNHTYTKKIGGDSIDLFLVFQVERETIMTNINSNFPTTTSLKIFVKKGLILNVILFRENKYNQNIYFAQQDMS